MRVLLKFVPLLFVMGCASAKADATSITAIGLLEDLTGHGLVSRSIDVTQSGRVTEERYNFLCGGVPHEYRKHAKLSAKNMKEIEAVLRAESFETLPRIVPPSEYITLDPPGRLINVQRQGHVFVVSWTPGEGEDIPAVKRFNNVWRKIVELLGLEPFVMPVTRPCRPGE